VACTAKRTKGPLLRGAVLQPSPNVSSDALYVSSQPFFTIVVIRPNDEILVALNYRWVLDGYLADAVQS
jgi:hypothetical protein